MVGVREEEKKGTETDSEGQERQEEKGGGGRVSFPFSPYLHGSSLSHLSSLHFAFSHSTSLHYASHLLSPFSHLSVAPLISLLFCFPLAPFSSSLITSLSLSLLFLLRHVPSLFYPSPSPPPVSFPSTPSISLPPTPSVLFFSFYLLPLSLYLYVPSSFCLGLSLSLSEYPFPVLSIFFLSFLLSQTLLLSPAV